MPPQDQDEAPVQLPIDGTLDLHPFKPGELKSLIPDYLAACRARDITTVRLIHGRGMGALRRTVHTLVARHPDVIEYWVDHPIFSGLGATVVRLRPRDAAPPAS